MLNSVGDCKMTKKEYAFNGIDLHKAEMQKQFPKRKGFPVNLFFGDDQVDQYAVQQSLVDMGLKLDEDLHGFTLLNRGGYDWAVYKGDEFAIMSYTDMSGGELLVFAKNSKAIDTLRDQFVALGYVKSLEAVREQREATAAKRMAMFAKRGMVVGTEVTWPEGAVIESISKAGIATLRLLDGSITTAKPGSLVKTDKVAK